MQIIMKGLLFRLNVKELEEYPVMVGVIEEEKCEYAKCKQTSYLTRQGQLCVCVARSKAWEWQER